jgi:hypothetical protein
MMHIIRNDEHGTWGKAHRVYLIHAPCFLPLLIYSFITSAIFLRPAADALSSGNSGRFLYTFVC